MGAGASSTSVGVEQFRLALEKPCDASDLLEADAEAAADEVRRLRRQLHGIMKAGQQLGLTDKPVVAEGPASTVDMRAEDANDEIDQIADAITAAVQSTYQPRDIEGEEHDPLRRTLESLLPQLRPAPTSPRVPQPSPRCSQGTPEFHPSAPKTDAPTSGASPGQRADFDMTTAAGRQRRLTRALPLKIQGLKSGAWAKALSSVVSVMASGDLAAANDDTKNHGAAFADQVSIGGDVFFIILSPSAEVKDEEGRERVLVVKFGRTTMETQSEFLANEIARGLGVPVPAMSLLRSSSHEAASLQTALSIQLSDLSSTPLTTLEIEASRGLSENLDKKAGAFLVQDFVSEGAAMSLETINQLRCPQSSALSGFSGEALGRIFVCDLVLRNADRLCCRDLAWRGNLTNVLVTPSSLVAIDTTLSRRPPRLEVAADVTRIPTSLARALSADEQVAAQKVTELTDGCVETATSEEIHAFQRGMTAALADLKDHVLPCLQERRRTLEDLFDVFYAEVRQKDTKLGPKQKRPSTATVRKLKKLKNEESGEAENNPVKSLIRDFELKVAEAASSLSMTSIGEDAVPVTIPASSFIDLGARALFVGAFEELVRLEHVTDRGDLVLVASAGLIPTLFPAAKRVPANAKQRPEDHMKVDPPEASSTKVEADSRKSAVPRVFVTHPDGAAATLSALTGRLVSAGC